MKRQLGGPSQKTKTVTKSPDGNYRSVNKSKYTPTTTKESSKTRRTLKGVVTSASRQEPLAPLNVSPSTSYMKRGGTIKKKK